MYSARRDGEIAAREHAILLEGGRGKVENGTG
jgi:hypothetical protein